MSAPDCHASPSGGTVWLWGLQFDLHLLDEAVAVRVKITYQLISKTLKERTTVQSGTTDVERHIALQKKILS